VGRSRSASLLILYLITITGKHYQEVFEFIREKRSTICPNPGFLDIIRKYERSGAAEKERKRLGLHEDDYIELC